MATNPTEGYAADFFEQITMSPYAGLTGTAAGSSWETPSLNPSVSQFYQPPVFPLSLSLDGGAGAFPANPQFEVVANSTSDLYPGFDQLQTHAVNYHPLPQAFQDRPTVPNPPSIRPRARARRGQATDPHSIAERLRRERISERIKALQEIVPGCTKVCTCLLRNPSALNPPYSPIIGYTITFYLMFCNPSWIPHFWLIPSFLLCKLTRLLLFPCGTSPLELRCG